MTSVSVAKHRYFKGKKGKQGTKKYIDYVTHREGDDRQKGGRLFFDEKRSAVDSRAVKKQIDRQDGRGGAVAHELILSPGVNTVDPQRYTRNIMKKLEQSKGLDLQWSAVAHTNTEHNHIHVIVMGKDAHGSPLRLNRKDYQDIREWGDRYIERNHSLDRFLERDADKIFRDSRDSELSYVREKGDDLFESLFGGGGKSEKTRKREKSRGAKPNKWEKERAIAELSDSQKIYREGNSYSRYSALDELKDLDSSLQSNKTQRLPKEEYAQLKKWIYEKERYGEDVHENRAREAFEKSRKTEAPNKDFGQLDSVIEKNFKPKEKEQFRKKNWRQRRFERLGRESGWHSQYQSAMEKMRLEQELLRNPEKREYIEQQLEWLKESDRHTIPEFERVDIDELLGWTDKDREREKEEREKAREREERKKEEEEAQNKDEKKDSSEDETSDEKTEQEKKRERGEDDEEDE